MKIEHKTEVNAGVEKVWKVVATDFDKASEWMALVPASHKIGENLGFDGAPMEGRVCQLSDEPNGLYAEEKFTHFDASNHVYHMEVVPKNGKIPVEKNNVIVKVESLGLNKSQVTWTSDITLKPLGKVMYPVLKLGLSKGFAELLEELKYFVETGEPHPRKMKALAKAS